MTPMLRSEKLQRRHAVDAFECGKPPLDAFLAHHALQSQHAGSAQTYVALVLRTLQAADIAGIRALAVHAKDDEARTFYRRFDFVESPTDPYHLFAMLKDLRRR